MGKFERGILGGFPGKVGTVIGSTWRGLEIMRSRPKKTKRTPTEEQLWQRAKFGLVTHFMRPLRPIISRYFGQSQTFKSRSNLATSYHLTDAIAGIYPDFTIDYVKVVISKGELLGFQQPTVTPEPNATLAFAWEDNAGQAEAEASDKAVIAVYNESRDLFEIRLAAATRTAMAYALALPATWTGERVECWITIASADNKRVANSIYMGSITLQ